MRPEIASLLLDADRSMRELMHRLDVIFFLPEDCPDPELLPHLKMASAHLRRAQNKVLAALRRLAQESNVN